MHVLSVDNKWIWFQMYDICFSSLIASVVHVSFNIFFYCGVFCIATAYGKGIYFSKSFAYSASNVYSPPDSNKNKHVLQCRVLTGHFHVGQPGLVEPLIRDREAFSLYDSVVDNTFHPWIFVVFRDTQVYPEYLVTFRLP